MLRPLRASEVEDLFNSPFYSSVILLSNFAYLCILRSLFSATMAIFRTMMIRLWEFALNFHAFES